MLKITYNATGKSSSPDAMGMREMQAMAYAERDAQYLLIKSPPASGKSRALMFLALDKLANQGIEKVIIAVPERSIGSSFAPTNLTEHGFFADWEIDPKNNLCGSGGEARKVEAFHRFMEGADKVLVCTHSTLRYAMEKVEDSEMSRFDRTLLGIDEFHHVSADEDSRLGRVIDRFMMLSHAHITAMTGSYFRGDGVSILLPEDEAKFRIVTYTYYDQLNGYQYLKSIGIDYHFYSGDYTTALKDVLDPGKKTIVHIPNVNSREAAHEKRLAVDHVIDAIGGVEGSIEGTNILNVRTGDGRLLRVANLVEDEPQSRANTVSYLQSIEGPEDMDVIVALGMAKEGFDWPWCEHVLTIGYRESLTEVVQIIGRATRDAPGKVHAQFTNLIAMPDATDEDRHIAVNDLLKAITASLLMEQILAPNIKFRPRSRIKPGEEIPDNTVIIEDLDAPVSDKANELLTGNNEDLLAELQEKSPAVKAAIFGGEGQVNAIKQADLPTLIKQKYPELPLDEIELVSNAVWTHIVAASTGGVVSEENLPTGAEIYTPEHESDAGGEKPEPKLITCDEEEWAQDNGQGNDKLSGNRQFVKVGKKFVNIHDLNIDLIESINPFEGGENILSKQLNPTRLRAIRDRLTMPRNDMGEEEAVMLWPRVVEFKREHDREPNLSASDAYELRLAQALQFIREQKKKQMAAERREA